MERLREQIEARFRAQDSTLTALRDQHDSRLRAVEVAIARLDAERAGLSDKAAAAAQTAITQAIADLRVRYAEEQTQRRPEPPALAGGEKE